MHEIGNHNMCVLTQITSSLYLFQALLEEHYKGRMQFEKYSQEMERKLDDYFYDLQEELVKVYDMEMQEFEERKNRQIANVVKDHDYHMYRVQDLFDCISMNNYLILSKLQVNILTKTSQLYDFRNNFLIMSRELRSLAKCKGFKNLPYFFQDYTMFCKI